MSFIDNVKPWFVTAAKPTQSQFWTMFGWLRWKDETLEMAEVDGLEDALAAKADSATVEAIAAVYLPDIFILLANGTYVITMGYLMEKMVVIPSVDTELTLGTTPGGNDILSAIPFPADTESPILLDIPAIRAAKTIYISGITASTKFYIYKR